MVNTAKFPSWINPIHFCYLLPSDLWFLFLRNLFLKFPSMMNCIPWVCTPEKRQSILNIWIKYSFLSRNRKTHLYIYLHLQVICLNLCVPGFIFYWNMLHWLSVWYACFKHSLESEALAQLSEIHIQRKKEQLPSSRIWCNEVMWGRDPLQDRWWHKAEFNSYIHHSLSFRNCLLLRFKNLSLSRMAHECWV